MILSPEDATPAVIPFIKVWGMVPGAIIGTWVYTRLSNRLPRNRVFYILVSAFLLFYLSFAFLIYPHHHSLHLHALGDSLSPYLPSGFKGLITMVCNWSFTLYYIVTELWASIIMSVLFWGFINDITPISQAKRFYGILNLGSNMAPLLGIYLSTLFVNYFPFELKLIETDLLGHMLVKATLFIVISALLAMYLFSKLTPSNTDKKIDRPKVRLSIRDSLKFVSKNKYLLSLALIVLSFNIAINFTDILWKHQLKSFFKEPGEMLAHMNKVSMGIGAISTLGALSFSFLISRMGWTFTALLTPLTMIGFAVFFFIFLFFGNYLPSTLWGLTPLACTVYLGSMQNCLSKAGKYSIFDASKELAFLNVNNEIRLKGKAAIDGLATGIGKSGSSLCYQLLLITLGSISSCTPYIAALLTFVFVSWFYSIGNIGKAFKEEQAAAQPQLIVD